jgi:hypothetical protein
MMGNYPWIYLNHDINNNKEMALNNLKNDNKKDNYYFNSNNFSFKPTNIQQVSSEEVSKFIQSTQQQQQQQQSGLNIPQTQQQPINNQIPIPYNQQQINNNQNQIQLPIPMNQQQQQMNQNMIMNNNIPNNVPLYPSPYPMVIGQATNSPPQMYNMPFNNNTLNMNQPMNLYPYPTPGMNYPQFPINPMMQHQNPNNFEQKEKKKVNYKPKSLKEYKEKYNNGIKEHRGGLGANIGGEEWEHKKEQNMKVKKYSEMIKNQNKEKENHLKKKINNFKVKNELNDQLYDSLSDEVLDDVPKEKKQKQSEKSKEKEKGSQKEKRPESNKVKYLMQLKKEKEIKEKENKEKESKENEKKQNKGKYSKYTKIVIESIDKNPNEKKLGKVYTTFKPKPQRRPSTKDKKLMKPIGNYINNNNDAKKRSQSTGFKNHANKKDDYDDELTKQFMSPTPNNYNGFINNKDNNNNFMLNPTVEIENLIHKKNLFDDKIKEIKKFLKK